MSDTPREPGEPGVADDLADVLAPPATGSDAALRATVLKLTQRRFKHARWLRAARRVAAVAVLFVTGGAVGWFARPEREFPLGPAPEVIVVPLILTFPEGSSPPVRVPEPNVPVAVLSASEAELRAEQADDRTQAAKLYRVAGDSFLRAEDYANATRCYRLFLTRAGDTGLSPEIEDSWLLTSLKNAAYKEKTDAPKTVD